MTDAGSDLPPSNTTRANITGKVPESAKPRPFRRGRGRKAKLSSDHRGHAKQLGKRGVISPKAAASHGLTTGSK
jgi:hypothetical protein